MKKKEKCEVNFTFLNCNMRENKWFKFGKLLYLLMFLSLESFVYAIFILEDFDFNVDVDPDLYKYESMILLLIFYFFSFLLNLLIEKIDKDHVKEIRYDMIIVGCALIFTFLSDTFLLYLDKYYEIGVSSFIVVQVLYFVRIAYGLKFSNKRLYTSIFIRVGLSLLAIIGLVIADSFSFLYSITGIYFINIVMNFIDSLISTINLRGDKRFITSLIFTIGLILFIGCDIFVGISNISPYGSEIIWIFYLPSQILIALSASRLYGFTLGKDVNTYEQRS